MQKTKLGVSVGVLGAAMYFLGLILRCLRGRLLCFLSSLGNRLHHRHGCAAGTAESRIYSHLCPALFTDAEHEADFGRLVSAIHESENKIRDYKHQIKDIKGVSVCEKCGAEVAVNSAFCRRSRP